MQIEFDIHWGWVLLYLILCIASFALRVCDFLLSRKLAREKKASPWSPPNFEQSIGRMDRESAEETKAQFPFDEEDPE